MDLSEFEASQDDIVRPCLSIWHHSESRLLGVVHAAAADQLSITAIDAPMTAKDYTSPKLETGSREK